LTYLWLPVAAALTGTGMGACVPAADTGSLQFTPDQVAAIAGTGTAVGEPLMADGMRETRSANSSTTA
jgi:hypothetical protein